MEIPTQQSIILCRECGTSHGPQQLHCSKCKALLPTLKEVALSDGNLGLVDKSDWIHSQLIDAACEADEQGLPYDTVVLTIKRHTES